MNKISIEFAMVLSTRLSDDYSQNNKQVKDITSPATDKLRYDNPIIGFGFSSGESYLEFKDGTKSDIQTNTPLFSFKVSYFDPVMAEVSKVRIHHKMESSAESGLFVGIELVDFQGTSLYVAGN